MTTSTLSSPVLLPAPKRSPAHKRERLGSIPTRWHHFHSRSTEKRPSIRFPTGFDLLALAHNLPAGYLAISFQGACAAFAQARPVIFPIELERVPGRCEVLPSLPLHPLQLHGRTSARCARSGLRRCQMAFRRRMRAFKFVREHAPPHRTNATSSHTPVSRGARQP